MNFINFQIIFAYVSVNRSAGSLINKASTRFLYMMKLSTSDRQESEIGGTSFLGSSDPESEVASRS